MAARYAFPRRLRLIGDQQVATRLIGHGDALLGSLMNRLTEARQRSGQETRIDQGVRYTYGTDGSMPYLTIEVAPSNAGTSATYKTAVWSPNGFVLRPATDDGKFGWGFPIVPASGGAYSPHNLAPGLNPSRWTAAGVLGEVLLTRVEGEIYPKATDITAPIMFSPDKGPKPKTPRPSDTRPDIAHAQAAGSMRAFRAECMGFTELAYGPIQVLRKDGLKLLNAHREDHGLDALSLPLRGNYSIAQNFANMCMATSGFGHYNPVFWEFYKVPGDRECHDGVPNVQVNTYANTRNQYDYTNENLLVQALEFDVVGTDINGEQYGTVVGASTVSAQVAFDGWLSSPPHRATIENVTWNGHSSFGDIGVNGFWVQSFVRKKQWIDCGNAYWFSEHEEIPPLSWDSFPQLNLAFETWPVSPHLSSVSPTRKVDCNFPTNGATFYDSIAWSDAHTVADLATMTFTTAADVTTSEGRFWRSTWYGANARSATIDADFARAMPYLTSAIYMRGRQIGIAPNAALVLGAAIQKISAGVIVVYRLHIIVHDQADQPSDPGNTGSMSVVHCYHCDLDDQLGYAAHNSDVIKGVRSTDPPANPWLEVPDRWSWVDDGTIAVNSTTGGTPDMLRYQCLWRFNRAGNQAACIRDFATVADMRKYLYTAPVWGGASRQNTTCPISDWAYFGVGVQWFTTFSGSTRTLTLDYESNPSLAIYGAAASLPTLTISGAPPVETPVLTDDIPIPPNIEPLSYATGPKCRFAGRHIALDYDKTGQLVYIKFMVIELNAPVGISENLAAYNPTLSFLAKGDFNSATMDQFTKVANPNDWMNLNRSYGNIAVADVNDFAFVQMAYDVYTWEPFNPGGGAVGNYNPNTCWLTQFFVEAWRDGALLNRQAIANHNFFTDNMPYCSPPSGTPAPAGYAAYLYGSCELAVPMYAKQRNGDWVFGYNVIAQPGTQKFTSVPVCDGSVPFNSTCWPNQTQLYGSDDGHTARQVSDTENDPSTPLGGWITSSFGDNVALASLLEVPGANLRAAYVRVV